jgi:hypothetical protein
MHYPCGFFFSCRREEGLHAERTRQSGRKILRREDWIAKCDEKIADLNVKSLIKDGPVSAAGADLGRKSSDMS